MLARLDIYDGPAAVAPAIAESPVGAVEIARPMVSELPYAALVQALLARPGFRLDFGARSPAAALDLVTDRILGPDTFRDDRAALARDIGSLTALMAGLAGGPPPAVSIRSYFAPGDLAWHRDRIDGGRAYRLVWPIARPAGMALLPAGAIDEGRYRAYMRREYALLGRMDSAVARGEGTIETLWAHRPAQIENLRTGQFPFVIDTAAQVDVRAGQASIHRVETPACAGSLHRSSWSNRAAPGVQIVITAASPA